MLLWNSWDIRCQMNPPNLWFFLGKIGFYLGVSEKYFYMYNCRNLNFFFWFLFVFGVWLKDCLILFFAWSYESVRSCLDSEAQLLNLPSRVSCLNFSRLIKQPPGLWLCTSVSGRHRVPWLLEFCGWGYFFVFSFSFLNFKVFWLFKCWIIFGIILVPKTGCY